MRALIAKPRVQIRHHRIHLLLRHLIRKRRHRSLPSHQYLFDLCIRRRLAIRQSVPAEDTMQTRRNPLQAQIILLVAVRAANVIQMLAFSLLELERRRRATTSYAGKSGRQKHCPNAFPISMLNSGNLVDYSRTSCLRILSLSGRANPGQATQCATLNPLRFLNNVTSRPAIILFS